MKLLQKMISAFLVVCMVISMVPSAAAAETEAIEGRIIMESADLAGQSTVWIDGVEYSIQESNGSCYVDLPDGTEAKSMVTYSYHTGDASDIHTQYPIGMQVWALEKNADGSYTPKKVEELNNILQYSGSSIRITGNKGIRMITSIEKNKKSDLISGGLAGYKLLEYGTVLSWASDLAGGNPLVLGKDYAKSNFAYKKDIADPVFNYEGSLMQYTNVLVGFTLDECADDIAMRPYMILEGPDGEQMTIYGGIIHRSIGYIAWQNRDVFAPGSAAYNYVWEIIRHVYAEVTFETNGGSAVESAFVEKGDIFVKPAEPTREGYTFGGWYTDAGLTNAYDFAAPVTADMTLYAKWSTASLFVTFHPNCDDTVTGMPESQGLETGEYPSAPQSEPTRNGYTFLAWYENQNETDWNNAYKFNQPITSDLTLYAKWISNADTDGEGLCDGLEDFYGTDVTNPDTDSDGISDYIEIVILGSDPLTPERDFNKDSDGDGIPDLDEIAQGTNPGDNDTDADTLTDDEEIGLGTDPSDYDTDGDGASDGTEVRLGTDPLSANSSFDITVESDVGDTVIPSVDITLSGSQVDTLAVDPITNTLLFPEKMPGYMGKAYNFTVEGTFSSATISFEFDASLLENGAEPAIFYFDEDNQSLEELDTTIEGNVASAVVEHFSTYVLIDRKIFYDSFTWEDTWDTEGEYSSVEIVLVIDDSGSMDWNDSSNQRLSVAQNLIDKLPEGSKIGIVKFANSTSILTPGFLEDREAAKAYLTTQYFSAYGGTRMYTAIQDALALFDADAGRLASAYAVSEISDKLSEQAPILPEADGLRGEYPRTEESETANIEDNNEVTVTEETPQTEPSETACDFATEGRDETTVTESMSTEDLEADILETQSIQEDANAENSVAIDEAEQDETETVAQTNDVDESSITDANTTEHLEPETPEVQSVQEDANAEGFNTIDEAEQDETETVAQTNDADGSSITDASVTEHLEAETPEVQPVQENANVEDFDTIDEAEQDETENVVQTDSTDESAITQSTAADHLEMDTFEEQYLPVAMNSESFALTEDSETTETQTDNTVLKMVVVLSDGQADDTRKHSATISMAQESDIRIYTVGLGSSTYYFTNYLKPLAENTEAAFYLAANADELASIYDEISKEIDLETDYDGDGIPDYYEENMIAFNGTKIFLDKKKEDTDGDGLKDGEEVTVNLEYNEDKTKVYVKGILHSYPDLADSDHDSIHDYHDPDPMEFTITDRTLAWVEGLSYTNLSAYVGKTLGYALDHGVNLKGISSEYAKYLEDAIIVSANDSDMGYWKDFWDSGLGSVAIKIVRKKQNTVVIYALRGTEFGSDFANDTTADVVLGVGWDCEQSRNAFAQYKKIAVNNAYDYYITGHSLGGRLAQDVLYKIYNANEGGLFREKANIKVPVHSVTFNGLGYNKLVYATLENDVLSTYRSKLTNYYYWLDLVGEGFGRSGIFTRAGIDAELLCKNITGSYYRDKEFTNWANIRDSDYHGINYFQSDYDLLYAKCDASSGVDTPSSLVNHDFSYWIS